MLLFVQNLGWRCLRHFVNKAILTYFLLRCSTSTFIYLHICRIFWINYFFPKLLWNSFFIFAVFVNKAISTYFLLWCITSTFIYLPICRIFWIFLKILWNSFFIFAVIVNKASLTYILCTMYFVKISKISKGLLMPSFRPKNQRNCLRISALAFRRGQNKNK